MHIWVRINGPLFNRRSIIQDLSYGMRYRGFKISKFSSVIELPKLVATFEQIIYTQLYISKDNDQLMLF